MIRGLLVSCLLANFHGAAYGQYLLGLGTADITGPVVETNMMGYANFAQTDSGLHMRQRSRVFIVASASSPSDRILLINADIAMGDDGTRRRIVAGISGAYPGIYTDSNIAFVGTHQHSGVGGYLENLLPQLTSFGFVPQTASAIVNGTVLAAKRAHRSIKAGKLSVGNVTILDANINRSPSAYLANPESERAQYQYDQDKEMTLLRFDDTSGKARGFMSFFPVHGTSLYGNNTLISGDNKGMAAYLYESMVEPEAMPGNATFVAGFVQSNVGDTSPNTLGAYCESPGKAWDGLMCSYDHSTCGNVTSECHGRGPAFSADAYGFASNAIIGQKQADGAKTLMSQTLPPVQGVVRSVHVYLKMSNYTFTLPNGTTVQTCPPALGYSFAGGTTDGPGILDSIAQGYNTSQPQNPFYEAVKGILTPYPDEFQKRCQYPKPVLLNTGYAHYPYEWTPSTVDIQMLRIGNLVILVIPGELTTMAGRRMRNAIRKKLIASKIIGENAVVVVAGPANTYAHYATTIEEYAVQRYEGGSTVFGQFTLDAYIDKYTSLVPYLGTTIPSKSAPSDPPSPELTSKALSGVVPVIVDNPPFLKKFGQVLTDVKNGTYQRGNTAYAMFVGANPRNNLRLEGTFMTVDKLVGGSWVVFKTDSHPSTTYSWKRNDTLLGTSSVNTTWTIESNTPAGSYRFTYYGDAKGLFGSIVPFKGFSSTFSVA